MSTETSLALRLTATNLTQASSENASYPLKHKEIMELPMLMSPVNGPVSYSPAVITYAAGKEEGSYGVFIHTSSACLQFHLFILFHCLIPH